MKACVKAMGEIVEIIDIDFDTLFCNNGGHYTLEHLEGIECDPDYWTRLEHTYAGMAMQGILSNPELFKATAKNAEEFGLIVPQAVTIDAYHFAHALVEKMKEVRK